MIPSAVSAALVTLEPRYDQSGVAVAGVPARSPWPAGPPHPPEAAVMAIPPVSPDLAETLLVRAAETPPEVEDPQWEDVILPS